MPRQSRVDIGNEVYHLINRANGRARIFNTDLDFKDFEYLLDEMRKTYKVGILAYVIMPNHWHLLIQTKEDKTLGKAVQWLLTAHVRRHHTRYQTIGDGHIYQGRYKSFLIKNDKHLLTVLKYIERNPVRAKLSSYPELWKWGSAHRRTAGTLKQQEILENSPVPLPQDYKIWIRTAEPSELLKEIRVSVNKGILLGSLKNIRPQLSE